MTEHAKNAARAHLTANEELVNAREAYAKADAEAQAAAVRAGIAWERMAQAAATVSQRAMELQEALRLPE